MYYWSHDSYVKSFLKKRYIPACRNVEDVWIGYICAIT